MPVIVPTKSGGSKKLYNPSERAEKYALELSVKEDMLTGELLTKSQAAYRMGYLNARRDNAKAYKHNRKKKNK